MRDPELQEGTQMSSAQPIRTTVHGTPRRGQMPTLTLRQAAGDMGDLEQELAETATDQVERRDREEPMLGR